MSKRRLVFLLSTGGASGLENAVELAKQLDARLEAFVLEDEQLHRASKFSFFRETGLASAKTRSLSPADLDGRYRADRRRIERLLTMAGQRYAVEWSLAFRKGRLAEQLLEAERIADWLAVSESSICGDRSFWQLMLGGGSTTREVFVLRPRRFQTTRLERTAVLAFGELTEEALEVSREVAQKLRLPNQLAVLLPPDAKAPVLGEGDVAFRFQTSLPDEQQLLGEAARIRSNGGYRACSSGLLRLRSRGARIPRRVLNSSNRGSDDHRLGAQTKVT